MPATNIIGILSWTLDKLKVSVNRAGLDWEHSRQGGHCFDSCIRSGAAVAPFPLCRWERS